MATLTRERILDRALELVAREGVRRFSASELARRLGVVKGALYHHFPDGKDEIVNAVFDREEERLLAAEGAAAVGATATRERLLAIAVTSVRELVRMARLFRVDEDIADELHGFLVAKRRSYLARERALIARVLDEGMAAGEVKSVDPALAAAAVQGAMQQVARVWMGSSAEDPSSALAALAEMFLGGIGGRP